MPRSVPRAMVNTGTPSSLASEAASIGWAPPWGLAPPARSTPSRGASSPARKQPPPQGGGVPALPGPGGGRRPGVAARGRRRGPLDVEGPLDAVAHGRRPLGVQRVDGLVDGVPVGGRPGQGLGGGGERDDPDPELLRELLDEARRGPPGRGRA